MCFVGGCLILDGASDSQRIATELIVRDLIRLSEARGTDGAGFALVGGNVHVERDLLGPLALAERVRIGPNVRGVLINSRLEPTNEWLPHPRTEDLQPYVFNGVTVVHNGTIANDKALQIRHGISLDVIGTTVDSAILPHLIDRFGGANPDSLRKVAQELDGSYALIIHDHRDPDKVYLACSYKPLWMASVWDIGAFFFASEPELLAKAIADRSSTACIERVPPYSGLVVDSNRVLRRFDLDFRPRGGPALCICSGGMDSTTAAAIVRARGEEIVFCHFLYGCKAESRERRAVQEISKHYSSQAIFVPMPWLGKLGGSSLTVQETPIADGNAGVEKAHEWVPARNLLMIAHAVALCERAGYGRVVLGFNEQEGEVFPDNEMEFLLNLQTAVNIGSPAHIEFEAPLARMSKRDIVRTALKLNVPLHLTWSCYRSADRLCGTCGSCVQRRVAFRQIGGEDFVEYASDLPASTLPDVTRR
jgi:7-cyano-7-deazaguanine synthase